MASFAGGSGRGAACYIEVPERHYPVHVGCARWFYRGQTLPPVPKSDSVESLLTDLSITNILTPWSGLESSIETKHWTALRALSGRKATPRLLPRTCSLP